MKHWNSNGNVGEGSAGLNLLPLLQLGERHKNRKNNVFFRVVERTTVICFKECRLQAMAIPLQVTGVINSTPHRAHLSRHTHNFSRRVHVAQDD